jgi:hypothetical protein
MINDSSWSEHRVLVGRRFEDYLRNGIIIKLTPEEDLWRMIFTDPRYKIILERRKKSRRNSDLPEKKDFNFFKSYTSFVYTTILFKK